MHFIEELTWRGLIQDVSDPAGIKKVGAGDTFYVGFDPTAVSLQIGNLIPLIVAMHLGRAGLKPLILFGGATGAIGDPSGRSSERQLLPREVIDRNVANQVRQVETLFSRVDVKPEFVNNFDWTKDVSVLEFLRDVGKHFTVNYMIAKDVVRNRIDSVGISYTEFSYMLLQAFDFFHLYTTRNCKMQMGGSEQWGNITAGLELIRRKVQGEAFGFCFPLLTDAQGKKFSKSESGTLWLDPHMTSPYTFHQFWLNVEDADAVRYLKVFSFLDQARISEAAEAQKRAPEKREAQHLLADSVCGLVHGEQAVRDANRSAEVLFGGSLQGLSPAQLEEIFCDVPSSTITRAQLGKSSFVDLLAHTALTKSKSDARRLVTSGGAYLNNERITDEALTFAGSAHIDAVLLVLRAGKKNYHLVRISD